MRHGRGRGVRPLQPPWRPTTRPTLRGWYRGDVAVLTSGKVSQWTDLSGLGNHLAQSNASFRPTQVASVLNAQSVIRFATAYLVTAAFSAALTQPTTIALVVSCSNQASLPTLVDGIAASHLHTIYCHTVGAPTVAIIGGSQISGPADLSTFKTIVAVFNGNNSKIRVNGTEVASGAGGAQDLTGLTVGESYNIAAAAFAGDIAELLVLNEAPAAADLVLLEGYLRQNYATW